MKRRMWASRKEEARMWDQEPPFPDPVTMHPVAPKVGSYESILLCALSENLRYY